MCISNTLGVGVFWWQQAASLTASRPAAAAAAAAEPVKFSMTVYVWGLKFMVGVQCLRLASDPAAVSYSPALLTMYLQGLLSQCCSHECTC
jgi:hypothetical protein